MAKITFYQITDVHNLSLKSAKTDEEYKTAYERKAVRDAVYDLIISDKETDIVLFTGDIADHGKIDEHNEFIEHTQKLKDAGKKIYLITATHDFGLTKVDENGESEKKDGVALRSQLGPMYESFGFNEAISSFERFSYVVKPQEGFRFMMLNDDGDGIKYRGYSDEQIDWMKSQLDEAKQAGDFVIAATHHPMLPPSPIYPVLGKHEMLGKNYEMADFFADNGVKFLFTGHTHMQAINCHKSKNGNKVYDINTGTISEFPLAFKKVTIEDGVADIKTIPVPQVSFDTQGKTANQYFADNFDSLVPSSVKAMGDDYDFFLRQAERLNIKGEALTKLKPVLQVVGKILDKATLGSVGKLLLCPGKVDKSIKNVKLTNFLASLLHIVYGGDEPYSPRTPEYKALMAFLDRLKPIWSKALKDTQFEDLKDFVASIIWDPTPDSNAILK